MEFSYHYWNSHRKGQETRDKILDCIRRNPGIGKREISQQIGRSLRQTQRQLSHLFWQGQIYRDSEGYFRQRERLTA